MGSSRSSSRTTSRPNGGGLWADRAASIAVGLAGSLIGTATLLAGPFVWFRPNRVLEGESEEAVVALGALGWVVLALWLLAALALFVSSRARVRGPSAAARVVLVTAALLLILAQTSRSGAAFALSEGQAARTSFGWVFYVFLFAVYLVCHAAVTDIRSGPARWTLVALPLAGVVLLAALGGMSDLGIVREWALTRSTFTRELVRHLFYASGATIGAIVIGVPLGILSVRRPRVRSIVMGALNLGQVLPVLAFIGIMMPIIGAITARWTGLRSLGIAGIGWAPVMVVLLVYAIFPVTRNTLVAIRQLDPDLLDAARGMGMGRSRSLLEVELPLAFPVVLAGIRIALVQSTGGAIIAAFVGGGGLGTFLFLGLEQTSMDLVLVGVLPIAAMALLFDALLRVVERVAGRGSTSDLASSTA